MNIIIQIRLQLAAWFKISFSHIIPRILTEAGGFRCIPLAQLSAMADVSALQDEASMAAVMKHCPFHWWSGRLHCHPTVLQGRPHSWAQQHWNPEGEQERKRETDKCVTRMAAKDPTHR